MGTGTGLRRLLYPGQEKSGKGNEGGWVEGLPALAGTREYKRKMLWNLEYPVGLSRWRKTVDNKSISDRKSH